MCTYPYKRIDKKIFDTHIKKQQFKWWREWKGRPLVGFLWEVSQDIYYYEFNIIKLLLYWIYFLKRYVTIFNPHIKKWHFKCWYKWKGRPLVGFLWNVPQEVFYYAFILMAIWSWMKTTLQLREKLINGCTVWFKPIHKPKYFFICTNSPIIWEDLSEQSPLYLEQYLGYYKSVVLEINSIRDSTLWMVLSTFSHL